jgi:hypothetical protein
MPDQVTSWFKEHATLATFLGAQAFAVIAGVATILTYSVKLETRVSIMETRGAHYTVARMDDMRSKITVLEQKIEQNEASIRRLVDQYLNDRHRQDAAPR